GVVLRDPERGEDLRSEAAVVAEEAEREVLGPDGRVVQRASLLLRARHHGARLVREAMEEAARLGTAPPEHPRHESPHLRRARAGERLLQDRDRLAVDRAALPLGTRAELLVERFRDVAHVQRGHVNDASRVLARDQYDFGIPSTCWPTYAST